MGTMLMARSPLSVSASMNDQNRDGDVQPLCHTSLLYERALPTVLILLQPLEYFFGDHTIPTLRFGQAYFTFPADLHSQRSRFKASIAAYHSYVLQCVAYLRSSCRGHEYF